MTANRPHSPITGSGKERRQTAGKAPGGIAPSWPTQGRATSNTLGLRRTAKPTNPDCHTDKAPATTLIKVWLRDGLTLAQATSVVRTTYDGDALAERALDVYGKMRSVDAGTSDNAFPLSKRDLKPTRAGDALAQLEK